MANKGGLNLPIRINDQEVRASFNEINKEYYKLLSSVKKLDEGTEEYIQASKRLAIVEKERTETIARQKAFRQELAKSTDTIEDQTSAMQEFGDHFSEAFSALRSGDVMAFRTAMLGVTAGIQTATRAALAFLATPIGIAITAFAGIAIAAQQWNKYNKEALEANRLTQQLTGLTGDILDQTRVRAVALQRTFEVDMKQSLEVASGLVNAFGISYEEAFDRIEDGLIRGGKENGEFLDSLKEYPRLFAQAGFTVEDFQRIVNTGIDMKIYSDKLPDAIKEFSLAIMEETTAAREAIENAFGREFTDKIFKGIQDGSLTSKDALQLISAEAENIGLNAQQAQLLTADLFKGAGEDAGGALVIFEAVNTALNEQVRALTPLEQELQRVAEANRRLEEAQNDALKSDQYSAFVNDISVAWINFKAGFFEGMNSVLDGLVNVDTKFRRFVFQSVQYTKDAFTIGKDADWEKLGKEFDKKQAALEERAAALRDSEKPTEETEKGPNGNGLKEQQEAEKKAAAAAKLRDARNKQALAEEKKRLDAIDALQQDYEKRKQDREANSELLKAELEKTRALEKAKAMGATNALLDQIEAEHQVKVDEARTAQEEKDLEAKRAFEEKKNDLENELELAKAETEAEKDEIKKQIALEKEQADYEKKLAKFEEEMAFLQLTEEEKNAVILSLKQAHENAVLGIEKKATDEKIKDQKRLLAEKKKILGDSLDMAIQAAGQESRIGQALLLVKQLLAVKETAIQLGLFSNKMALNAGEASSAAATGAAETAKVGFPQNIPLLIGFGIQIAGIISAVKNASKAKSGIKTSFYKGGFTDMFGMGYKDETGHEPAGIVHKDEYVVPKFMRQEPEVPQILNYLETKRKKKLGLFADGGGVNTVIPVEPSGSSTSADPNTTLMILIERFMEKLDQPLQAPIYFDMEAEMKRQEQQKKLEKIQNRSKIKTE